MWIKNTNEASDRLYSPWMEEFLEEPEDSDADPIVEQLPGEGPGVCFEGAIQVKQELGEELCDRYETVEPHESDN